MFRDQGTTSPMAELLQPLADVLRQEADALRQEVQKSSKGPPSPEARERHEQARQVKAVVDWLAKRSFAYEAALPLELGKASRRLRDSIKKLAPMDFAGLPPLATELTDTIASVAQKAALADDPARRGLWKTRVSLDEEELERQAQMIDLYLDRGQLPLAVGLMREWVVSWAILKSEDENKQWLDRKVRLRYERRLGAIGAFARKSTSTPEQQEFGDFWNQLANDLRNALHHHAMREEGLEEPPNPLESVRCFWDRLKAGAIDLPELGSGGGRLLLSPQGTKPGVLFSALKVAQPDTCLVICSATSASSICEAGERAGFQGSIEPIELTDPLGGFDEINASAEQAHRSLLDADKVVANMTGGTTLMGLVVQRLAEEAQKLDRPVRRFALIDRRPPAEQDSDPFVQGDYHWLDD